MVEEGSSLDKLDTMLRVLYVCTGNRCRSPFAAASLAKLTEGLPVEVESAGLADLGSVPPTSDAVRVASSFDVNVGGHRARSLYGIDALGFDAVIGFERNHIATAVVDAGVPYERAFLLPELARLLETSVPREVEDPVERARAALEEAHRARGTEFVPGEEIEDPIGRPVETYEAVYTTISELNAGIADALFGAGDARSARPAPMDEGSLWNAGPQDDGPAGRATIDEMPLWSPGPTGEAPVDISTIDEESLWSSAPQDEASEQELTQPADGEPAVNKDGPIPEATST